MIELLSPDGWRDYALLDSGEGMRLERFGPHTLARPDSEAIWHRRLPESAWAQADATYQHGEEKERWHTRKKLPAQWALRHRDLVFYARLTPFKHTGVFPEQAALWDWMRAQIEAAARPINVLTLFGYTGLAALSCAAAGASVTYVDASKWASDWARENQTASGLDDRPVRWIVEDALKYARREARRGVRYDALVMDPPSFGRGPKGEVWKFADDFPALLEASVALLSDTPLFVTITGYAMDVSSVTLANLLNDAMGRKRGGHIWPSELTLAEQSGGRTLSTAIVARWMAKP
ncbi:MAG: class I SAM-dependent methyltransferase [Chloroflexi bacterium]|nr:class I SAM-dependent methyltransferase [Chloroflexota bacterium]